MRIFTFTLVLLASAMMFRPAIADAQALEAIRICNKMVKQIDLLVEYTKTLCVPAQGRNGMSFFFVSQVPIFSIEASKKWWLLVVAGVFGETFNANAMKSDEVAFSDVSMVKSGLYFRIPAKTARTLQRRVLNGEITLDSMYEQITAAMELYSIP